MKVFKTLLSVAGLSLVSAGRFAISPAKRVSSPVVTSIPRGGGLMEPDVAAKTFIYAYGPNAAICVLAPKVTIESIYGGKPMGDAEAWITSTLGAVGTNTALLLFLQHVKGMAFEKAIGLSVLPYLLNQVFRLVVSDADKAVGLPKSSHLPGIIINLAVLLTSFSDVGWAPRLNYFYGLHSILNGVYAYLSPDGLASSYGINAKSPLATFLLKTLGYFLLAHGIAVSGGGELLKQIGYSALAVGVGILGLIISGSYAAAGMPILLPVIWSGLVLAIGSSLIN